ncbi:hypothetical protein H6P81_009985 [Aristolochia fimbriata]|uniref:DUF659 domain-containing protein n=1 Tax=Aristolochia fimbriata TaxID=158543 RepID=A0AAV7EMI5_ARIFI|nr:hypothetical protein H6P81_009985 [Aristolochia fimbriata]
MIDAAQRVGQGVRLPKVREIKGVLLKEELIEMKAYVDSFRDDWHNNGCIMMCDSGVVKDAQYLFKLMDELVQEVGPHYIVHIIIDNASNYKSVGKMIEVKYESIYWSSCVAQCMNLVIEDLCKLKGPRQAITFASKVTTFITMDDC